MMTTPDLRFPRKVGDDEMVTIQIRQLRALALSLALLFSSAGAQSPPPGFADPVLGRWDLTVEGPDRSYPSWLEISLRKEVELMGRFVGQFGSLRHIAQVDYRGGDLTFRIPVQYEQNAGDLVFRGRLEGDQLRGTTESADGKTLTWVGRRAPALERAAAPRWGRPIRLFNGKDLAGWKLRGNDR